MRRGRRRNKRMECEDATPLLHYRIEMPEMLFRMCYHVFVFCTDMAAAFLSDALYVDRCDTRVLYVLRVFAAALWRK